MFQKWKEWFDVIITGGGTAGTFCAIAAAREGMKTAIIEKNAYLGGMSTGAGLTEMNAAGFQSMPLYQGIEKEIFDELISKGHAQYHFQVPMSSNPDVKVDRLRYDPEILKIILEEKAIKAGIELFYESEVQNVKEEKESCSVSVQSRYNTFVLEGGYLVDATGNADIVRKLGKETIKTDTQKQLTSTLMFRLSGVNMERFDAFLKSGKISGIIQKGCEQGVLKGKILAFTPIPGAPDVSLNVTRTDCEYEDVREYSRGIADARSQILPIFEFIKREVPGIEKSYISNIAPFLGVRDARRISGKYMLTLEDLENMTEFEDSIALGCYPMDIHDSVTKTVIWKTLPGVYYIPYRSLLPEGLHRTLAVGKCICTDKEAFGAVRVMPIMMNIGESAGYILALARRSDRFLDEMKAAEIRNYLNKKYGRLIREEKHE